VDNYPLFNNNENKIKKAVAIYRNWWCNPFGNNVGDQTKEQTDEDFAVC